MHLIDILICPDCKTGNLNVNDEKVVCENCDNKFFFDINQNQIVFKELYTPKKVEEDVFSLNENKKKNFSWRELNYLKIEQFVKDFPVDSVCIDIGSGPMTNKNLLKKFNNIIYMDGAKFNSVNIVCDFEKVVPLKSNSADAIILSNVLEHIFSPQTLLKEIYRVLKNNGKCLILVPYSIKLHQEPHDYFRYTKYALKKFLEDSNFINHKIEELGSITNVLDTILKHDRETPRNKNFLVNKLIFIFQWCISKLFLLQCKLDSTTINNQLPQGYSVIVRK